MNHFLFAVLTHEVTQLVGMVSMLVGYGVGLFFFLANMFLNATGGR